MTTKISLQHQNKHVLEKSLTGNRAAPFHTGFRWKMIGIMENDWDNVWLCLWWR